MVKYQHGIVGLHGNPCLEPRRDPTKEVPSGSTIKFQVILESGCPPICPSMNPVCLTTCLSLIDLFITG